MLIVTIWQVYCVCVDSERNHVCPVLCVDREHMVCALGSVLTVSILCVNWALC